MSAFSDRKYKVLALIDEHDMTVLGPLRAKWASTTDKQERERWSRALDTALDDRLLLMRLRDTQELSSQEKP